MKTTAVILGFLMLPFLGTTEANNYARDLSGIWKSECGTLTLILDYTYGGLRVKNNRSRSWSYYDQDRRGKTFSDRRSRKIKIRSRDKIRFEDKRARVKLDLYKVRSNFNNGRFNNGLRSDSYGRTNGRAGYSNRLNNRYDSYTSGLDNYDAKKLRKSIDDKWENREYGVEVRIKDTDTGIKLKRDGDRDYYYYTQDRRNPRFFADARGNTVEIANKYEIIWYDSRRGQTLYFIRD